MERSSTFLGTELLGDLTGSDGMKASQAQDWIGRKAGRPYDPDAMYRLRWPEEEDPKTWEECPELRVNVMSDVELLELEQEYRRLHHLPPRKPWEPPMYGDAMGRIGR